LKRYLWKKKLDKPQNVAKVIKKTIPSTISKVVTIVIAFDNHMVVIQIHVGKKFVKVVLLDGGSKVHIITR
jgi:hypothetical protein